MAPMWRNIHPVPRHGFIRPVRRRTDRDAASQYSLMYCSAHIRYFRRGQRAVNFRKGSVYKEERFVVFLIYLAGFTTSEPRQIRR